MTVRCVLQLFRTFLVENSESLLGFPTISRWAQFPLRIHWKRIVRLSGKIKSLIQ